MVFKTVSYHDSFLYSPIVIRNNNRLITVIVYTTTITTLYTNNLLDKSTVPVRKGTSSIASLLCEKRERE